MDFSLRAELKRLLLEEEDDVRLALVALALLGLRLPEQVAAAAATHLPPADLSAAVGSQWLRETPPGSSLIGFLEPLRHEVSLEEASELLTGQERDAILTTGLAMVRQLLRDDEHDPDRGLLCELHLRLGEAGYEVDDAELIETMNELLKIHWQQGSKGAARTLMGRGAALLDGLALSSTDAARWAVIQARGARLLNLRADATTAAAVAEALRLTEGLDHQAPELRILALLEESRLRRDADVPESHDRLASRRALEAARELINRESLTDHALIHAFTACEYALLSAEGSRSAATDMALSEYRRCLEADGSPTYSALTSLSDAAWYAARSQPERAIQLSEQVLEQRVAFWGTPDHPRAATAERDLAVRLVRVTGPEAYPRALTLARHARSILERAFGPFDSATLSAMSAESLCLRKLAYLQWSSGATRDSVRPLLRESLAIADAALAERRRLWPRKASLLARERRAAPAAMLGDDEAYADLVECLRIRREDRAQPDDLAEVTWLMTDIDEVQAFRPGPVPSV
jgi:hypothetical protein